MTDAEKREAMEVIGSWLYSMTHEQFMQVSGQVLNTVKSMTEKTENGGAASDALKNDDKQTEKAEQGGGVAFKTDDKQAATAQKRGSVDLKTDEQKAEKAEKDGSVALKTDEKQAEKAEKGGNIDLKTDEKGGSVAETFKFEQSETENESFEERRRFSEGEDVKGAKNAATDAARFAKYVKNADDAAPMAKVAKNYKHASGEDADAVS